MVSIPNLDASVGVLIPRRVVPTQAKTKWTHPCQCTLIAHGAPPRPH